MLCGWRDGRGQWFTAALACGEQDEVELDDREEEAREEPAIRVAKISRGPIAEELASHLPLHEPGRPWCPPCVAGRQ